MWGKKTAVVSSVLAFFGYAGAALLLGVGGPYWSYWRGQEVRETAMEDVTRLYEAGLSAYRTLSEPGGPPWWPVAKWLLVTTASWAGAWVWSKSLRLTVVKVLWGLLLVGVVWRGLRWAGRTVAGHLRLTHLGVALLENLKLTHGVDLDDLSVTGRNVKVIAPHRGFPLSVYVSDAAGEDWREVRSDLLTRRERKALCRHARATLARARRLRRQKGLEQAARERAALESRLLKDAEDGKWVTPSGPENANTRGPSVEGRPDACNLARPEGPWSEQANHEAGGEDRKVNEAPTLGNGWEKLAALTGARRNGG